MEKVYFLFGFSFSPMKYNVISLTHKGAITLMISWPMTPPTIAHTGLSSAKQKLSKEKKQIYIIFFLYVH